MEQEIVQAVNDIGLKLLTYLRQQESLPSNALISPLCIVLTMLMLASTIGPTQRGQLYYSMGLSESGSVSDVFIRMQAILRTKATDSLASTNAVFVQDNLASGIGDVEFLKALGTMFAAYASLMNAKDEMNERIFQASHGAFKDFVSSNQLQDAVAVFINILSFKGIWQETFAKIHTKKDYIFHQSNTKTTRVEMMFQRDFKIEVAEHQDCTIVRLPFKALVDHPAMFLEAYMPHTGGEFDQVIQNIRPVGLQFRYITLTEFGLPRFQIHTVKNITGSLEKLGFPINDASILAMADNGTRALYNTILHGAAIEVDEEGSRAAAVTAIVRSFGNPLRSDSKRIIMDRPFLFTITEKLGLNLFIGVFSG